MASKGEARAKKFPGMARQWARERAVEKGRAPTSLQQTAVHVVKGRKREREWAALISIMHCRTLTGLLRNGVIDRE